VAGPEGLAGGAIVAVFVGDCAAYAFLAEGCFAGFAGGDAVDFFEGAVISVMVGLELEGKGLLVVRLLLLLVSERGWWEGSGY